MERSKSSDLATLTQQSLFSMIQPSVVLHQPGVKPNQRNYGGPKFKNQPIQAKIGGGVQDDDCTPFIGLMPSWNQKGNLGLEMKNHTGGDQQNSNWMKTLGYEKIVPAEKNKAPEGKYS